MRCKIASSQAAMLAAFLLALSACSVNGGLRGSSSELPLSSANAAQSQTPDRARRRSTGKIKHVVIIIQENRSFNNLFYGFPGATTQKYGYNTLGQKIALQPVGLETNWDLEHDAYGFEVSCNGTGSIPGTNCKMNGFNRETFGCLRTRQPKCPNANPPYSYVPHSETKPYFDMGKQYVVADQMYASNLDASSFISHQYIIAGQAMGSVNYPYGGIWGCEGGSSDLIAVLGPQRQIPDGYRPACYSDTSLGQEADAKGVTWAFYAGGLHGKLNNGSIWSGYQANKYVFYGSDWKNDVISPQTKFFGDVSNGKLRQISWITPTCPNSDHAGCNHKTGPDWVASLVNAIGESKYWESTAIIIFWDDYGGWYDPEPPAYVDYDGLGLRIPMIVVSAYAKVGHVSHVHYEHGSILKFVEDQFGLPRLAASDTRATSIQKDCFDFKQAPRPFKPITSVLGKEYFMHQPLDFRPPDTQ